MGNSTKIALDFQALNIDSIVNALKEINTLSNKIELPKNVVNQINDLTQSVEAMKASTSSLNKQKVDVSQFKTLSKQFEGIEQRVETLEKLVSTIFEGGSSNKLVAKITEVKNIVTDTTSAIQTMGQALTKATDNPVADDKIAKRIKNLQKQVEIYEKVKKTFHRDTVETGISNDKAEKASVKETVDMLKEQIKYATEAGETLKKIFDPSNKQWPKSDEILKITDSYDKTLRNIEKLEDSYKGKKLLSDIPLGNSNIQNSIDVIKNNYSDFFKNINGKIKELNNKISYTMQNAAQSTQQAVSQVRKAETEVKQSPVTVPVKVETKVDDKEIQENFVQWLNNFRTSHTKYSKSKTQITIPLHIPRNEYEMLKTEIDAVLEKITETIKPIEVNVGLVTGYKTKKNEELASQLMKSLDNINDQEVKERASNLIDTLQRRLSEQLHLDFEVYGTENAKTKVQKAVAEIQKVIDDASLNESGKNKNIIQLQAKLSDDSIANITKQLEEINWKPIKIDLKQSVKKGESDKETKATKKELTPLGAVKKMVELITTSVNEKTEAFKNEAQVVATESANENVYLQVLLDSFTKIRDVLSEISSLSGSIGDIRFKIDGENLTNLVNGGSQITTVLNNNGINVGSKINKSSVESAKVTSVKEEIKATEELNAVLQETKASEKEVVDINEQTVQTIKAQSEAERQLIMGLIEARDMAREYSSLEENLGHNDVNTIAQGQELFKHLQTLFANFKNIDLNQFNEIATFDDAKIQGIVRTLLSVQKEQLKVIENQKLIARQPKNAKPDYKYKDYGEILENKELSGYSKYADKIEKALRHAKQNAQELYTNINNIETKYPLSKSVSQGLAKIIRDPKSEANEAATEIYRLAGEYVSTGATNVLDQIKEYANSSNLSDKMKTAINNSIDRFIKQLSKQIDTASTQAVTESITPTKMKTVTMNKGQYKEWYQTTSGLGNSEFFDRNFERQVNGLISQGKAKKSGNSYSISVDVDESNFKKLEELQAKWEEQKKKNKKSTQELTDELNKQAQIENQNINQEINKTEQVIQKKQEEAKSVQTVTEAIQQQQQEVVKLEKVWSKEELEVGFQQVKKNIEKYGNFNLSKKSDKEGLLKQVDQYIRYQQLGGSRPITDLTDNQKALAKITAEYEKQIRIKSELINKEHEQKNAIEQSIQAESNNEKNIQNSVSKEKQELLQEASAIVENVEQKQLAKISNEELLDSYNRLLKIIDELRGKIKGSEFLAFSYKAGSLEKEIGNRNIGQTVSETEKETKTQNTLINNYKKLLEEEELLDKYKTLDKASKEKINEVQYDNLAKLKNESISVYEAYERIAQAFKDLEATTATTQLPLWSTDENEKAIQAQNALQQELNETSQATEKILQAQQSEINAERKNINVVKEQIQVQQELAESKKKVSQSSETPVLANSKNIKAEEQKVTAESINGMIQGMEEKEQEVYVKGEVIALGVLKVVRKVLDIKSPSGEFRKIGIAIIEGIIKGLEEKAPDLNNTITNISTNALKISKDIVNQNNPNPLTDLQNAKKNFEPFYKDSKQLATKEGQEAALQYYIAYQKALEAKVNKKDLQANTLGKMSELFSGNYSNYKKGVGAIDTSGLTTTIETTKQKLEQLSQPQTINNLEALTIALQKLTGEGKDVEYLTNMLKSLISVFNLLSNDKSADRLVKIQDNLSKFATSLSQLKIDDNGLLSQIDNILKKSDELKTLSDVVKANKKAIDTAVKGVSDTTALEAASNNFNKYYNQINEGWKKLVNDNSWTVISTQMEPAKDGLIHIKALIKDVDDSYKELTYTTATGDVFGLSKQKMNDVALGKQVRAYEELKALMDKLIPDAQNIGTVTPDNENWGKLIGLIHRFGIEIQDVTKVIRQLDDVGHESFQIFDQLGNRVTLGVSSEDILGAKESVVDVNKNIQEFSNNLKQLGSLAKKNFNLTNVEAVKLVDTIQKLSDSFTKLQKDNAIGILSKDDLANYAAQYKAVFADLQNNWFTEKQQQKLNPEFVERYNQLSNELSSIMSMSSNPVFPTADDINRMQLFTQEAKQFYSDMANFDQIMQSSSSIDKLLSRIYKKLKDNDGMVKELKTNYEDLINRINSSRDASSGMMPREQFKGYIADFEKYNATLEASDKKGKSFWTLTKERLKSTNAQLVSMYFSFYRLIGYIRTCISTVIELDSALLDLKKTTTMNNSELEGFYVDSSKIAKDVGVTTKEIITQAAAWSRLGYSSKEAATEMAQLSSVFAKISPGTSVEDATDYLVSTMKAFHIEVSDVEEDIMSVINKLGNTMATSNAEIGEMLKRSSAAMAAANNSLAQTAALESAAVQITRNAETTGTAFRTISMRIRGYDEETEELSEDYENLSGAIADLTKTAKTPGGISLFTDANKTEYKSTYQLLKDISEIYNDLTDKDQAKLLEKLAGKRGGQALAGILSDFSEVERAMSEIENSAGSAAAEMAIVEETLEYKINAFKATWTGVMQSLIDKGTIGNIVDGFTKISEAISSIVENKNSFIAAISAITGMFIAIKGGGVLDVVNSLKSLNILSKATNGLNGLFNPSIMNNIDVGKLTTIYKDLDNEVINLDEALVGLNATEKNIIVTSHAAGQSAAEFSTGLATISAGAKIAKTALNALATGAIMLAASLAIKGLVELYDKLAHRASKTAEAAKSLRDAFESAQRAANDNLNTFNKLSGRIKELSKGVNYLGNNVSLTADEFEEYKSIQQTIADMSPKLISGYDEQGRAIVYLKDNVDSLRQSYEDAQAAAYDLMIVGTGEEGSGNAATMTEDFLNMFRPGDHEFFKGRQLSIDVKQRVAKYVRDNIGHIDIGSELLDLYNELQVVEGYGDQLNDFYKELGIELNLLSGNISITNREQTRSLAATMYQTLETSKEEGLNTYKQLFNSFLKRTGSEYYNLNEDYQKLVSTVINNIDIATAYELAEQGSGAVSKWVENQIKYIQELPDEYTKALNSLQSGNLNFSATKEAFDELYNYLTITLGLDPDHPLISYIKTVYEDSDINKVASKMGIDYSDNRAVDYWEDFMNDLSDKEIDIILNADDIPLIKTIQSAENWLKELKKRHIDETTASISESIKQLAIQMDPYYDEIGNFYQKIFVDGYNNLDKSVLDNDTLESFRSKFEEISEEVGVTFNPQIVDDFWHELQNAANSDDAHKAIDKFATEWLNATNTIKSLNEDTARYMQTQLENWGVENAEEVVESRLKVNQAQEEANQLYSGLQPLYEDLIKLQDKLSVTQDDEKQTIQDKISTIEQEIAERYKEAEATEIVKIALFDLQMAEAHLSLNNINSSHDVSEILKIAQACGVSANAIAALQTVEAAMSGGNGMPSDVANRMKQSALNIAQEELDINKFTKDAHIKLKNEAGKAGADSGKTYVDEFEEALKNLQFLRDNDVITLKHYLDQEKKLIDDFYHAGKMSAEDYFKHIHDWLREMLDLYNSVISDVTNILQKEIDKLEKTRDKEIKELEKQRDEELEALDEQIEKQEEKIKKKQKEIDLLEEANQKRKQELDLQKALYELERSRNQRTNLVYKEGFTNGPQMVYQADPKAIKEAQEEVEEQKYQKRLSILEKELELLNSEKDKLDEQRQAIEDHYQELIDKTNEYYDQAIERIQEYMDMWSELAEIEERALMTSRLESLGLSMEDILNLDIGSFEAFKENYIGILADIYRENDSMTDALGREAGELNSYLGRMQQYFDSLSGIDLSSVANAMASVAPDLQTIADCMPFLIPEELRNNIIAANESVNETEEAATNAGTALEETGIKGTESGNTIAEGMNTATSSANDLTKAITGQSEGGEDTTGVPYKGPTNIPPNQKGNNGASLISSLEATGETSNAVIGGDSGVKGDFDKAGQSMNEATNFLTGFFDKLTEFTSKTYTIDIRTNFSGGYSLPNVSGSKTPTFDLKDWNNFVDSVTGKTKFEGTVGNVFFNGYPGLNAPEYSALRSEFGQPELTVFPDGTYELTTTPTFSDLPKDTVIFNEEQTKRILNNSKSSKLKGKSFANGTSYSSLQDIMPDKADMFTKFESKLQSNLDKMTNNMANMASNVREITTAVTTSNINNNGNTINMGNINVTCPGITETEVAKNLGAAIRSELNGVVSGMALRANQLAMRR